MRSQIVLIAAAFLAVAVAAAAENNKIVCYLSSWAVYRKGEGKFEVEDIDPSLCTHVIYTFVGLDGFRVKSLDPWQDLPDDWGRNGFGRLNALKKENPSLKTLVAIGGWSEGSINYSKMASYPSGRLIFVKSVVKFVKDYDFDGLDLDWEYPAQRGGSKQDVENYVALLKNLREAFDKENLLLSAAVAGPEPSASLSYNISEISKYLDFINIMTYDFHGSWDNKTGLHAALYPGSDEDSDSGKMTVNATIRYWLDQGAPPEKLILGVPSYGRSFTLADPDKAALGDAITGAGISGPYTRDPGVLGYNEICEMLMDDEWTVKYDADRGSVYAHFGDQWVSYDNVQSAMQKARYVKEMGLGGAALWSVDVDDFRGKCGDEYPILRALNSVLRN